MIDSFLNYVDELNMLQTCFLAAMIGGGLLFFIEIIISTIGGGMEGQPDGLVQDLGTSDYAFRFFSLFSVSAFMFTGGCFGMCSYSFFDSNIAALLIAVITGVGASILINFVTKAMLKLQTSGNVLLENAIGQTAIVYLKIPAAGKGQVEITLQGRKKIMSAMTEGSEEISTGTKVKVTDVNSSTLVVSKFNNETKEGE